MGDHPETTIETAIEILERVRVRLKWNYVQISKVIDVSTETYRAWRRGKNEPPILVREWSQIVDFALDYIEEMYDGGLIILDEDGTEYTPGEVIEQWGIRYLLEVATAPETNGYENQYDMFS